nr:MAG TPA: DASH complex subunit Ask1 [Caudoviricetes sp.]
MTEQNLKLSILPKLDNLALRCRNLNQKASQWKLFFYGVRYGSKR